MPLLCEKPYEQKQQVKHAPRKGSGVYRYGHTWTITDKKSNECFMVIMGW